MISIETLANVARRPFQADLVFEDVPGLYIGAAVPLSGLITIRADRRGISAEITNRDEWRLRMIQALPRATFFQTGELFRTVTPNVLLGPEAHGSIVPEHGGWEALQVTYVGHQEGLGDTPDIFRFAITELVVPGPAHGAAVAASRHVYAGGDWSGNAEFQGHPMLVRDLVHQPATREDETIAVSMDWQPDELSAEALWLVLSFITGNAVNHLAEELYDEEGRLIRTAHHLGRSTRDVRRLFFHRFQGQLAPNGIGILGDGFARLMRIRFPIEVILEHLHQAAGQSIDVEAQHLVLAIHTAIEAWNRQFGIEEWIDTNIWETYARNLRRNLIPDEVYDDIGQEMQGNIRDDLAHSNRTTTSWRERQLFERLQIPLNGDDRRALKLRNELLHNGYFLARWGDLTLAERQQRHLDVERMRRLILLVVFRLTAYAGQFMNPVTYAPESIDRIQLPAEIAPPP